MGRAKGVLEIVDRRDGEMASDFEHGLKDLDGPLGRMLESSIAHTKLLSML